MNEHPDTTPNTTFLTFRSHTALLLATALPFLQPAYRHPVELITKFLEFSETIKLFQEFHLQGGNSLTGMFHEATKIGKEGGIFGLINTFILDLEGLLHGLTGVCTGDEKEIIHMFLNIIRAKNFYETYGDLLNMGSLFGGDAPDLSKVFHSGQPPEQEPSDAQKTSSAENSPFSGDLSSMLNEEQKETLDLLKSLFSTD